MGTLLAIGSIANAVSNILKALQRLKPVLAAIFTKYPALGAALLQLAAVLAARFGFHATPTELAAIASALAAVLGVALHVQMAKRAKRA